ncbi:MAG: D-alanine--D-alanine ligase, partial [Gammaproteobacteria bacterium]|nr:D-alanine--D-alanine ligase [Gammaproteobacteria bacterium]
MNGPPLAPASNLVARAALLGRVAVVYGGRSAEREVSLASGQRVLEGLAAIGTDVVGIDHGEDFVRSLLEVQQDRVFVMLH